MVIGCASIGLAAARDEATRRQNGIGRPSTPNIGSFPLKGAQVELESFKPTLAQDGETRMPLQSL